jgi:hypothetical protein
VEHEAQAESEAHIAAARRESLNLEAEEEACLAGLDPGRGTSPSALKVNGLEGLAWFGAAGGLVWAGYHLAVNSLSLLGGHDDSRYVVAAVLAGASAGALELFLRQLRHVLSARAFRTVLLCISAVPVLCLLAAALVMAIGRADHSAVQQALALQDNQAVIIEGVSQEAELQQPDQAIANYYARTRLLTMLLVMLAAIGLETTAALALHQAATRLRPSLILLAEQRRLRSLRRNIAACASAIYHWQQYPLRAREAFTRAALLALAWQRKRRMILLIAGAVFLAMFLLSALTSAAADELVIVALDLSTSSAGDELRDNTRAVEAIIARLPPGARLVVIPINEHSFSSPPILDARLSSETGLFAERIRAGRRTLAQAWNRRASTLQANAKATNIFAALRRAAVLREEAPGANVSLILLTDARHHARGGYSLEGNTAIDRTLVARVEREGLIPPLKGVQVWVLGAHANDISDTRWIALRSFWRQVFMRSGATLTAFSAERRWNRD